jgi:hypothetical protein
MRLVFATLALAALTVPTASSAQETPQAPRAPEAADRPSPRFRSAVLGELGPRVYVGGPDVLFDVGVQGHVGVQISDLVGLYAAPFADMVVGGAYGPNVGTAIVVDFTIADTVALGLGPEMSAIIFLGGDADQASSGAAVGGRIHAAWYPVKTVARTGATASRSASTFASSPRRSPAASVSTSSRWWSRRPSPSATRTSDLIRVLVRS